MTGIGVGKGFLEVDLDADPPVCLGTGGCLSGGGAVVGGVGNGGVPTGAGGGFLSCSCCGGAPEADASASLLVAPLGFGV